MNSWVIRLIIANAVMFLLTLARPAIVPELWFVPVLILERPWTVITYMFLHGGWDHILFNMLGLLFFGPRLEMFLGERRFLWLYAVSGLMAAVLSSIFSPMTPIIGASGAIYGVFLGFAYFWPRDIIRIWGVFPIEARWMVVLMTLLSLWGGFGGSGGNIAHFAHLGGFVGAFVYLRWLQSLRPESTPAAPVLKPAGKEDLDRWQAIDRSTLHEVNRDELDRIRMKLQTEGPSALTESERQFLNRFSVRQG